MAWETNRTTDAGLRSLIGRSAPMQAVFASIRRCADEQAPVLITGLIGTGKELAAGTLQAMRGRENDPMVVYRCCGVTEALAHTELFGDGSPSTLDGEPSDRRPTETRSILELARGATLLLDEVGDLPAAIQSRLAHALKQSGSGGAEGATADDATIWLLATSRLNLAEHAARGQFNEDLYRILSRNVIHLPSLGERQEDIPLLCRHFVEKFNVEFDKQLRGFSAAAERTLMEYPWPGNVRELENVIGRACLLADESTIELCDLSIAFSGNGGFHVNPSWGFEEHNGWSLGSFEGSRSERTSRNQMHSKARYGQRG